MRSKIIICCLACLLLVGCSTKTGTETDLKSNTEETDLESVVESQPEESTVEVHDWFSETKYPIPMGIVENGTRTDLVNINIPESLSLSDVRVASFEGGKDFIWNDVAPTSKDVVENEMLKDRSNPLCFVAVDAPMVDYTTMYFVINDGVNYNVSDIARDYADKGSQFDWEGHTCFLLGTDADADAAKYGDLTVFYEVVPDGAYVSLGYIGPLEDTKTDMEIAENLCSLVEII